MGPEAQLGVEMQPHCSAERRRPSEGGCRPQYAERSTQNKDGVPPSPRTRIKAAADVSGDYFRGSVRILRGARHGKR